MCFKNSVLGDDYDSSTDIEPFSSGWPVPVVVSLCPYDGRKEISRMGREGSRNSRSQRSRSIRRARRQPLDTGKVGSGSYPVRDMDFGVCLHCGVLCSWRLCEGSMVRRRIPAKRLKGLIVSEILFWIVTVEKTKSEKVKELETWEWMSNCKRAVVMEGLRVYSYWKFWSSSHAIETSIL
jgi:hypothetical protein